MSDKITNEILFKHYKQILEELEEFTEINTEDVKLLIELQNENLKITIE